MFKNHFSKGIGLFVLMQLVFPLGVSAQSVAANASHQTGASSSQTAQQGTATVSISQPTNPVFDDNHSDDDIIQLNNLRISEIIPVSSNFGGMVIVASTDFGVSCKVFTPLANPVSGKAPGCAPQSSQNYQIRVNDDTRLILRNRKKAQLSDFEVGDIVNVYGFRINPETTINATLWSIDALILRNVSKPALQRSIQLNSVEVIAAPSSLTPPSTIVVLRKQEFPCLDFSGSSAKGLPFPCPLGTQSLSSDMRLKANIQKSQSELAGTKYIIEVTQSTQLFLRDRSPAALSDITVGDRLNVYGVLKNDGITLSASVVRDVSKPEYKSTLRVISPNGGEQWQKGSNAVISWIAPPDVSSVDVYLTYLYPPCPPDMMCAAVFGRLFTLARQVPNTGKFEWSVGEDEEGNSISDGSYVVVVKSTRGDLSDQSDGSFQITSSRTGSPPVIYGVGGPTNVLIGETGTWTIKADDPDNGYLTYSVVWGDELIAFGNPGQGSVAQGSSATISSAAVFTHTYASAGTYMPTFTVTNSSGASAKTSVSVNVQQKKMDQVSIQYLSPAQGSVGTLVVILGNGFTETGNTVHFGYGVISSLTSNGTKLVFNVPDSLTPGCYYSKPACLMPTSMTTPGDYPVSVSNANGESGKITFTVTARSSAIKFYNPDTHDLWDIGVKHMISWSGALGNSGALALYSSDGSQQIGFISGYVNDSQTSFVWDGKTYYDCRNNCTNSPHSVGEGVYTIKLLSDGPQSEVTSGRFSLSYPRAILGAYLNKPFSLSPLGVAQLQDYRSLQIKVSGISMTPCAYSLSVETSGNCGVLVSFDVSVPVVDPARLSLMKGGSANAFGATITLTDAGSNTATFLISVSSAQSTSSTSVKAQ